MNNNNNNNKIEPKHDIGL